MNGAGSIAQLMGGVRRLAALAHSARDEETVLRALRYELHYALDVDEVRFETSDDGTWPSLPLIVDSRRRGSLIFVTHPHRPLAHDEIDVAAALIEAAAAVIALQAARQAARVDSLTSALNHGAMLTRLEEEIDRARRYRTGLAEWADPETPHELLAKADQALLAGKRAGKDQLRTAAGEWPWEEEPEPLPNQPAAAP